MKSKHLAAYMKCAEAFAECSTATRLKVGAVIVKDNRILSTGYNGTAPGTSNVCEYWSSELPYWDGMSAIPTEPMRVLKTHPEVIHAEMNAILKAARDGQALKDSTLICTHQPCKDCAKAILTSGISSVYYRDSYRSHEGEDYLVDNGISVRKI